MPIRKLVPEKVTRGFTLIELIVVITIIGLLASIVATSMPGVIARARGARRNADMKAILNTAKVIYTMTGRYPESIEEMVGHEIENGDEIGIDGYPRDPWNNEYLYSIDDGKPRVVCLGRDGAEGGEGEDADRVLPSGKARES